MLKTLSTTVAITLLATATVATAAVVADQHIVEGTYSALQYLLFT